MRNFALFFFIDISCQNRPLPLHRESNKNRLVMLDIGIYILCGIVALLIIVGVIVAVGYAALFTLAAVIGGILTLIDKVKTLKQ